MHISFIRHVCLNLKDTYAQCKSTLGLTCSKSTMKKIFLENAIENCMTKRRPFLTEKHAARRLAWCKARRGYSVEERDMVARSDECSVERGRGKRDEWLF